MGRSLVSPQKNKKKHIKISNDSYRETSKGQQKSPGLQKSKLISLDEVGQKIKTLKKNGRELKDQSLCHEGEREL